MAKKTARARSVEEISQQFLYVMHFYNQPDFNKNLLGWREDCNQDQRLDELLQEWEVASPNEWKNDAGLLVGSTDWETITPEVAKLFLRKEVLNTKAAWGEAFILACKHDDIDLFHGLTKQADMVPPETEIPKELSFKIEEHTLMHELMSKMSKAAPPPPGSLEMAAKHSAVKIIRELVDTHGFPPESALQHAFPGAGDSLRVAEICTFLQLRGVKITDSLSICTQLRAAEQDKKHEHFRISDVLEPLLAMGLDLNAAKRRGPILLADVALTNNGSSAGIGHEINLKSRWPLIDSGCCLPDEVLHGFKQEDIREMQGYLPVADDVITENNAGSLAIEPKSIPRFLRTMRPEALVCRCAAFNLIDSSVFEAILAAENQRRTSIQDTQLNTRQLFALLPPFLQVHERMLPIQQMVHKEQAAEAKGLEKVRAKAQEKRRPKVE